MIIAKKIDELEKRISYLEYVLESQGLPASPWVSPQDAAKLMSISRTTILGEIKRAEDARLANKPTDLKWGKHYRKNGSHWQVKAMELEKVIFLPIEERMIGI